MLVTQARLAETRQVPALAPPRLSWPSLVQVTPYEPRALLTAALARVSIWLSLSPGAATAAAREPSAAAWLSDWRKLSM